VPVAVALGSILIAVLGTVAALKSGSNGSPALASLIWVVIGVINVTYAAAAEPRPRKSGNVLTVLTHLLTTTPDDHGRERVG